MVNHEKRRKELADFLRTRRSRLSPQQAGLQVEALRRRTPGLRREEVASLSGISLPWYTALEQGRDIQVSDQVLESLVRTLRLSKDERRYLYTLANPFIQQPDLHTEDEHTALPGLQPILDRLGNYPAYIIDNRWNVTSWNPMITSLCGDLKRNTGIERNLLWRVFIMEKVKKQILNWDNFAGKLLAHFRSQYAMNLQDPWYEKLVDELFEQSDEFRLWWAKHEVSDSFEGVKIMDHPDEGHLTWHYHTFAVSEGGNYMLRVYTPAVNSGDE
ncbi:helix-turn-helix transcriptional regulator [Paenibacillus sp. J22TS3]|uniref:helix-turn-helix transcriptional regulator n=1 Tax=Paenibacillus sp. J22TS3 TaxID=2807192 RepID=UPI001B1C1160|nr:helix-turn-helix transcriptional regulator [Paenibacillus sp. J22TS3]GIP22783.1 transcriptional regulator [Paenibacillus sp. J22TS3]